MNPGNNPMNGRTGAGFRTPMGVPPKGLMGSSSGGTSCHGSLANGGPIPKLQVQPGTPLPPSTRSTPVPCYSHLDRVIEEKPQLPQIIPSNQQQTRAPPSGDPGATPHDVAIKLEPHPYVNNGYSSSCATPGAMGPPSGRPPPHSAHQLQMMAPTPTPSDMSSLPSTARRPPPAFDKAMCPASGSTCDTCMMPLHKMRDSWQTQYKVLPSLGSCSDTADHQSMPGTQESVLQSFFTEYSYSPNPSSFNSPGQSARQFSKKRAMSTSTLSSEGVDIAAIIRCSPNALGRFMGGSHGSSSNGSPQPAQPAGSITHLVDVRSNNSSPPAGSLAASTRTNMKNYAMSQSSHLQTLHCMGHLEQQGPNLQIGLPGVIEGNSNLVVQQQPDMFYMEQFLKPEPKLPNNFCENMSNETATIPPPQLTSSLRPPPPPYPGASSHHSFDIPSAYHSPLANTSINDSSPEEGDTSGQCHDDLLVEDCDKPHMCKWIDCNQLFAEQDELVRHIEKQHIDQRRGDDFTCYWQGCQRKYKPFNARYKLLIHMRVHSGEKPNKCTHIDQRRGDDFTCYWQGCQRKYKPFNARYKLLIHMRVHSIPMPNKCTHIDQRRGDDFTCYWQGCQRKYKPFNARYKLLIHMRVHSIPMPNKCTFEGCDKAFSRLENLKIHLRSHTGERPYLCQHSACPKAFSNSSDRAKHQRTHLDTYKGCNKEFTRLENLKIHLRWHTGEKPYHCQHEGCPKTFTNPSDRSKHQRTHYDPKPYGCQVPGCNKRYTDPSSLRKHVKSHDTKEQQARKKVRTGKDDVMGPPLGMMGCLAVKQMHHPNSPMDVSHNSPRPEPYPVGMQFGMAVVGDSGTSAVSESQEMAQTMGLSDNFERRIGPAGFNRNLMSHRVNMPGMANIGPISMPSLQVVKMGHQAISYSPEQTQPAQEQWPQTPLPPPVTTPSPCEAQTTTPDALQQTSRPTGILDSSSSSNNMPTYPARPYGSIIPSYDNPLHQHLQVPNHQRMPHVNIVPQAGNVPIANDYASMPCNLQERIIGQQNPHTFTMSMSVEETLANLPYDAITLSRALSNHSGFDTDMSPTTQRDVDMLGLGLWDDNQLLQVDIVERCNSRLSAVSVYGDGSTC